eukprot:CAMPEP_0201710084 /NCGR_PEP_ID=MMETSP0578-20130828/58445_1 /ASSEMBLY_ACC=CAM_ASM_000663 /TAXON_ID=267565 /ORGANISM="Skeletonema grethea, Strain CCMP 1804" /LENGTH=681 /DNA_ID=CAMNT_0048199095 /DNA_START=38 /DNA_END=2084 /DNA_ORIENTATION=-
MDLQDYNYYEANAADVNLEEITSSAKNAKILQRLRDCDDQLTYLNLGMQEWHTFIISEGDDLRWLGYFIGKSQYLKSLNIWGVPEGDQIDAFVKGIARNKSIRDITVEFMSDYARAAIVRAVGNCFQLERLSIDCHGPEGEQIDAFVKGIARNKSIRNITIRCSNDDARAAIVRAVGNCFQLERLSIDCHGNLHPNSHSALQTLLESGVCSLRELSLYHSSDDVVTSFANGFKRIAESLEVFVLSDDSIGNEGLLAVVAGLASNTSLKELEFFMDDFSLAAEGLSSLSEWLQSLPMTLQLLNVQCCRINDEGLQAFAKGAAFHCRELDLEGNESITATGLILLDDFSLAAEGLSSLSEWLQSLPMTLQLLNIQHCQIDDEGLQAFAKGAAISCRELHLEGNESITATGLSCLSNSLQSESCCIETLNLFGIPSAIGDDGMKALARGLAHNTSLKSLRLGVSQFPNNDDTVPPTQWLSFSNALCDPSSVNNTYFSNHTIHAIMDEYDTDNFRPEDIDLYLRLNEQHPKHAARCKILMTHPHLDMQCFLQWDLKLLPVALTWFEQAKACTTLNVQRSVTDLEAEALVERRVVEESDKVFESRVLSAMYEFVRGRPMQVMESRNVLELTALYDDKIAKIEEEHKKDLEQRDGMNVQLQEEIARLELENKRLSKIVESVRNSVGV